MKRNEVITQLNDLLLKNDRQFLPTIVQPKHVDAIRTVAALLEKERDSALPAERPRDHPNRLFRR